MPRTNIVKVDLSDNLKRYERGVMLASADKAANKFGAEVYQDGKAASLTGYTVVGYYIRTGVDTITINGTVDGNKAYVVLPESCYYQDGAFTLSVKLRKSGYEQTLAIFDGIIAQTITDRIIDSAKAISFVDAIMQRSYHNLLDNSNFAINQRGNTAYSGSGYTVDRWKTTNSNMITTVNDGFITLTVASDASGSGYLRQIFETPLTSGKFTLAVCVRGTGEGRVYFATNGSSSGCGATSFSGTTDWRVRFVSCDAAGGSSIPDQFTIRCEPGATLDIKWAALYEGTYTAATLPPYATKGYAHELLECQRFYHVYATAAARPVHGLDCVPHMRLAAPTQGTIAVGGATRYFNAADL